MAARSTLQIRQLYQLISRCPSGSAFHASVASSVSLRSQLPLIFVRHQAQAQLQPIEGDAKLKQEAKKKPPPEAASPAASSSVESSPPKPAEAPLADPPVAGQEKSYAPKIRQIVDDIAKLTVLEVADLNELLKKTLRIPDQAFMSAAPVGGAASTSAVAGDDEVEKKKEKTVFTVKLLKFDDTKKVQLIKEVKNLVEGMNLVQAKKFVESLPQTMRQDIPKEEAEKLKAALEAVGGVVEMD